MLNYGESCRDPNRMFWQHGVDEGYHEPVRTNYGVVTSLDPAKHRTRVNVDRFAVNIGVKKLAAWSAGPRTGVHGLSAHGAQELLIRGYNDRDWHAAGVMYQSDYAPPDHPDFAQDPYGAYIMQGAVGLNEKTKKAATSPGSFWMTNRHGAVGQYTATLDTKINAGNQVQGNKGINLKAEEKAGILASNKLQEAIAAAKKIADTTKTVADVISDVTAAASAGTRATQTVAQEATSLRDLAAQTSSAADSLAQAGDLMESSTDMVLSGMQLSASADSIVAGASELTNDLSGLG